MIPTNDNMRCDEAETHERTTDSSECTLVMNCNWLFTQLPLTTDHKENHELIELLPALKGIPFFFNTNDGRIIWSPTHCAMSPGCLDPALLSREEIVSVVQTVNSVFYKEHSTNYFSAINFNTSDISIEALKVIQRLARAYIIRKHHREKWSFGGSLSTKLDVLAKNEKGIRGLTRFQAIWRSYTVRQQFYGYLKSLMDPNLMAAGRIILKALRRRRCRFLWSNLFVLVSYLRKKVIQAQALWRGYWLRKLWSSTRAIGFQRSQSMTRINPLYCVQHMCALIADPNHKQYKCELTCLAVANSVTEHLENLLEDDRKMSDLDTLIGALVKCRSKKKNSNHLMCVKSVEKEEVLLCGKQDSSKPSPLDNYSGLIFLIYTQPDYWARLLVEIPNNLIWRDCKEAFPETLVISNFGGILERLVMGFFRFGRTSGDEARLLFLIARALHIQFVDHQTPKGERPESKVYDVARGPCPMALRLAISLAHTQHVQTDMQLQASIAHHDEFAALLKSRHRCPRGDAGNCNNSYNKTHSRLRMTPLVRS